MLIRVWLVLTLLAFPAAGAAQERARERPTLVVLIAVDQLRPDYFERYATNLMGGLARLLREGAYFTESELDHATTETAPGHSSMLSGRFPRSHGILRNPAGVQDPRFPTLGDPAGASPFRFRGSTLLDWIRLADPRSRALSVSRKDRGAILPIGRSPEDVYWYVRGGFTTSTYYRDTLPNWVRRFNERRLSQRTAGRVWDLLLPPSAYAERDSIPQENWGRDVSFPHRSPLDSAVAADSVIRYPWMDEITLAFALEGVRALGVGSGPPTDLLSVSLSATDYIGHRYGPFSREAHDQFVRLDRLLGAFLDSLFTLRDPARTVLVLTADHGVTPSDASVDPRELEQRVDLRPTLFRFRRLLAARGADSLAIDIDYGMLMVNAPALAAAGVDPDSIVQAFLAEARQHPGVLRADDVHSLARADTVADPIARRWLHSLPPDAPIAAVVTVRPNRFWVAADWANHGTPHDYDARVPILFWGAPFTPGRFGGRARVVDIAPTLAEVLGITPTEALDGRVLREILRQR
jgi:hypothetical protein